MDNSVIKEENEKTVNAFRENATFLVIGDEAYTSEIIEEYNRNAEAKINEFNSNAADRTANFNNNYDDKVATFNSNATTKTEEFDNNATTKETNFNSNVSAAVASYNRNAAQRTDEFNQNALSYKEGITEVSNRTYRIENDLFDSGEASGTSINLQDSTLAEFKEVSVDSVGEQKTTIGKNLYNSNITNFNNKNVSSFEKTGLSNGDVGGNAYKLYDTNIRAVAYINLNEMNTYTISSKYPVMQISEIDENGIITKNMSPYTFTNTENTICVVFKKDSSNTAFTDGEYEELKNSIQIEEGSTATEYEPYTGGIASPNPNYPQEIEVIENDFDLVSCGKNLVPNKAVSKTSNGITFTINEDKSVVINGTATAKTSLILLEKDRIFEKGTYTLSLRNTEITGLTIGIQLDSRYYPTMSNRQIELSTNTTFKKWYIDVESGTTLNNVVVYPMLVYGNKDSTNYEPYTETRQTITIPENEFAEKISDTYKDKFRISYNEEDGKYHLYLDKNIGKDVLNGSKSFDLQSINSNGIANFNIILKDYIFDCENLCMCDRFTKQNSLISNTTSEGIYLNKLKTLFIRINKDRASTIEELKTWLSENPVTVYYVLAEPYTIDLGIVDMPLSYYPVTNIYTTCPLQPTIEVEYYRDFKSTIVELQNTKTYMQEQIADSARRIEALEAAIQSMQTSSIESEVVE